MNAVKAEDSYHIYSFDSFLDGKWQYVSGRHLLHSQTKVYLAIDFMAGHTAADSI